MRRFVCLLLCLIAVFQAIGAESAVRIVETFPRNSAQIDNKNFVPTELAWQSLIQNAKHSIVIGSFFFTSIPRTPMEKIVQSLKAAAERQVKIQILIDDSMRKDCEETVNRLRHPNIEIRYIDFKAMTRGVMHAKYMIVDEQETFVGSQNFGLKALLDNHELGFWISDPALAKSILNIFQLDWALSTLHTKLAQNKYLSQARQAPLAYPLALGNLHLSPAASPKGWLTENFPWELKELLALIQQAHDHISIEVYQYSDLAGRQQRNRWTVLDDALIAAAKRGVQVNLMVSEAMLANKAGLKGLERIQHIPHIVVKIRAIPPVFHKGKWFSRVDHAKMMVIDDRISWIGTGNWQKDYFYKSRDFAIILEDSSIGYQLQNSFSSVWNSKEATTL